MAKPESGARRIAPDQREALLRELAALHATTRARCGPIARRRLELPERDALLNALATLDRAWTAGPYSEPARRVLADNAPDVHERLARFDELATQLARADADLIVSHGEPHPGNLIQSPTGLRMIDWDTVALAEPRTGPLDARQRSGWTRGLHRDDCAPREPCRHRVLSTGVDDVGHRLVHQHVPVRACPRRVGSRASGAALLLSSRAHRRCPYAASEAPELGRWPTIVHRPAQ